jgi:dethiobiotin synthetase
VVSTGSAPRPSRLVVVTGTGTTVGKTWWAARVVAELRAQGWRVAARKPVQSFDPAEGPTDADVLAAATGEPAALVCPRHRWYPLPWAPPMAAAELGAPPFTIADLVAETAWPVAVDVGLVEGVGGPRSPLARDGDSVDFAVAILADVVVVVGDAGLGAINALRLAVAPFAGTPTVVVLNRFGPDRLHERNREHLVEACGFDVVTEADALADRIRPPRS